MASLTMTAPRALTFSVQLPRLFSAFRPSWSQPCEASSSSASALTALPPASASLAAAESTTPSSSWSAASLLSPISSLLELLPPIILAVPKHKVTHSRKSMRSANKGPRNKTNFNNCEACGQIKLAHNICPNCYSLIAKGWKQQARDAWAKFGQSTSEPRP